MLEASEVQGEDSTVAPTKAGCLVMDDENKVSFAEFVNGVGKGYHEISLDDHLTPTFPVPQVVSGSLSADETNVLRATSSGTMTGDPVTVSPPLPKSADIIVLHDGTPVPPKVAVETPAAITVTPAETPKEPKVPAPKPAGVTDNPSQHEDIETPDDTQRSNQVK